MRNILRIVNGSTTAITDCTNGTNREPTLTNRTRSCTLDMDYSCSRARLPLWFYVVFFFNPRIRPLVRKQPNFDGILVTEQAYGQGAVEPFNNRLVAVNVNAPAPNNCAPNNCFVVFHFFGHTSHELATGVNLQQLRQLQRSTFVNRLKSFSTLSDSFEDKGSASLYWLATSTTVSKYLKTMRSRCNWCTALG